MSIFAAGRSRPYRLDTMICKHENHYVRIVADNEGWKLLGGNVPIKTMPDWPAVALQCQMLRLMPVFYLYKEMHS